MAQKIPASRTMANPPITIPAIAPGERTGLVFVDLSVEELGVESDPAGTPVLVDEDAVPLAGVVVGTDDPPLDVPVRLVCLELDCDKGGEVAEEGSTDVATAPTWLAYNTLVSIENCN
jgi:hypothetical protein